MRSNVSCGSNGKCHHAPSLDCCIPAHASKLTGKETGVAVSIICELRGSSDARPEPVDREEPSRLFDLRNTVAVVKFGFSSRGIDQLARSHASLRLGILLASEDCDTRHLHHIVCSI